MNTSIIIESPTKPQFLSEPEIQLLIALIEIAQPKETPNNNHYRFHPQNMEEAGTYFKSFRMDWSNAYHTLQTHGLISFSDGKYSLTERGIQKAVLLRDERPPIYYWYREFYSLAPKSKAHALFCRRLYGKNLCQANFSDMIQLHKLISLSDLGPGDLGLDIGCGTGMIAEYISDTTGSHFIGADYSSEAIEQARARTETKREYIDFQVANFDSLSFPSGLFNVITAIDTLYMPNNLTATLQNLMDMLAPGGQLLTFYSHSVWETRGDCTALLAENSPLGVALRNLGLPYETYDFSEQTHYHLERKYKIAVEMRQYFEAEGTLALYNQIIAESTPTSGPFNPATCSLSRYLYRIRKG